MDKPKRFRRERPVLVHVCQVQDVLDAMKRGGIARTPANVAKAVAHVTGYAAYWADQALAELSSGGVVGMGRRGVGQVFDEDHWAADRPDE